VAARYGALAKGAVSGVECGVKGCCEVAICYTACPAICFVLPCVCALVVGVCRAYVVSLEVASFVRCMPRLLQSPINIQNWSLMVASTIDLNRVCVSGHHSSGNVIDQLFGALISKFMSLLVLYVIYRKELSVFHLHPKRATTLIHTI
jgi:tetrahydromethanopterin S-methyltransferase subunit C